MGLRNWYRFSKGTRSRGRDKGVGLVLAIKIRDDERDRPKVATVADVSELAGYRDTATRHALDALEALGELHRDRNPGGKDSYRIVWEALKPPNEYEPDHEHAEWEARHTSGALDSENVTRFPRSDGSVSGGNHSERVTRPTRSASHVRRGARHTSDDVKAVKAEKGAPVGGAARGAAAASDAWRVGQIELADAFDDIFAVRFYSLPSEAQHEHSDARLALGKLGAGGEDVRERSRRFRDRFPSRELTPSLLVDLWPSLTDK